MTRKNSSSLISPSPSRSASSIISWISSSVSVSPSSLHTRFRLRNEIFPVLSSSNNRNILSISSRESREFILPVIISINSSRSIVPDSSLSMSAIIWRISAFFTWKPSARIAAFSSLTSIEPLPSVSNSLKASLISSRSSSSNAFFAGFGFRRKAARERANAAAVLPLIVARGLQVEVAHPRPFKIESRSV